MSDPKSESKVESKSDEDTCEDFLYIVKALERNVKLCLERGDVHVNQAPLVAGSFGSVHLGVLKLPSPTGKPKKITFIVKRVPWLDSAPRKPTRYIDDKFVAELNPFYEVKIAKILHQNLVNTCSSPHVSLLFGSIFCDAPTSRSYVDKSGDAIALHKKYVSTDNMVDIVQERYGETYQACVQKCKSLDNAFRLVKEVTFQVFQLHAAARSRIPEFSHNDLHVGNVMVSFNMYGSTLDNVLYRFVSREHKPMEVHASYNNTSTPFATVIDFGRATTDETFQKEVFKFDIIGHIMGRFHDFVDDNPHRIKYLKDVNKKHKVNTTKIVKAWLKHPHDMLDRSGSFMDTYPAMVDAFMFLLSSLFDVVLCLDLRDEAGAINVLKIFSWIVDLLTVCEETYTVSPAEFSYKVALHVARITTFQDLAVNKTTRPVSFTIKH